MRNGLLATSLALLAAAPAAATPTIHAHRGGSVLDGVPAFPENTLPAFRHAAANGWVLELDVELTRDGVPVVLHDNTLDRTTVCSGRIADTTLAALGGCPTDVLGSPGSGLPSAPTDAREPVPTLEQVLDLARETGARLNVEIKNVPNEDDFDPTDATAERVVRVLASGRLPSSQLLVQSFWPPNLDVSERLLPAVETSLLTLAPMNPGNPAFSRARDHEWISPQLGPDLRAVTAAAHGAGRRVVPYTANTAAAVRDAAAAGADAVITDDPVMARRALRASEPAAPAPPPAPTAQQCAATRAARTLATVESFDPQPGAPRVFAMQFKQDLRHVLTYGDFRRKIECLVIDHVVPRLAHGRPNVVAFNEDIGLMTIATGARGAAVREAFAHPEAKPSCEPQGAPCGTLAALGAVTAVYGPQVAAYRARFGVMGPARSAFVGATDTFARGFMQTFSDIARRYGVYILGSNNQAPFRESRDPEEVALFADPEGPQTGTAYVATSDRVYNEVFLWGPQDVREDGPRPLRNVVASNKKVPLTPIEVMIDLVPGPATGPDAIENLRPYRLPGTEARIGFATSLPAFVYGPQGGDPCADVSVTYMRCLDALGTTIVMQDEANPGRWASAEWEPQTWMASTWRAASDPTVSFPYNVTPHMVGNLADLVFDGQTAITQRGLRGPGCHYVGNGSDQAPPHPYLGPKPEFLAMLPWVVPDAPRPQLREVGTKLAPGSGDALENDYVEGAIAADLPFPPDPDRAGCAGVGPAG